MFQLWWSNLKSDDSIRKTSPKRTIIFYSKPSIDPFFFIQNRQVSDYATKPDTPCTSFTFSLQPPHVEFCMRYHAILKYRFPGIFARRETQEIAMRLFFFPPPFCSRSVMPSSKKNDCCATNDIEGERFE